MQGAGTLQAKRKSNHWYEIKPVQEKNVRRKISKVHFWTPPPQKKNGPHQKNISYISSIGIFSLCQ